MIKTHLDRSDEGFTAIASEMKEQRVTSSDDIAKMKREMLKLISDQQTTEFHCRRMAILASLRFDHMEDRRRIISEHHRATYEWCCDHNKTTLPHGWSAATVSSGFVGLLVPGNSTLMKFLIVDKRTHAFLRRWSNDRKLLTVDHYFYYAGTHMDKSHQGLLQSLLSQILQAQEDLTTVLCGDGIFGSASQRSREWSREGLVCALRNTADAPGMRFCLFVDGLDTASSPRPTRTAHSRASRPCEDTQRKAMCFKPTMGRI